MNEPSPDDTWELSKENVKPIRQGRTLTSLNAGLKLASGTDDQRIKEEQHLFEAEIRTYSGDDPIDVWYRYILWAEQSFPTGGSGANLTKLLQRCARMFQSEEKYRDDERYVYVWMKLADISNEPLEMYNYMFDQSIGCALSCFYEGWACLLEQLANYKKADTVYQKGLAKCAQPHEQLKLKHENFQKRVAMRLASGDSSMTPAGDQETEGQHRQVLSQLRTRGKQKRAPINRAGAAIQGGAGRLTGARPKATSTSNAEIQIYCDENQNPGQLPPQTGHWATAPHQEVTNKENEKKAGVWTKQKMSKTGVNVPIQDTKSYTPLPFTVHVDDNNDQSLRTPAKMPEIQSQGGLSIRKADKKAARTCLETVTSTASATEKAERVMYCKDKIYCGIEEYSFEELRSVRWLKQQEQRKQEERAEAERVREEEEAQRVQALRDQLEQERLQLQQEADQVRLRRLQLKQELQQAEQAMLEVARRKQEAMHQQLESERQRQQQLVSQSIETRLQEQEIRTQSLVSTLKSNQSARQLMFDDNSKSNHGVNGGLPLNGRGANAALQAGGNSGLQHAAAGVNHSFNQSLTGNLHSNNQSITAASGLGNQSLTGGNRSRSANTSTNTPNSFYNTSLKSESFERTLSGAPSPTVNTKEAMRLVLGMFNGALDMDNDGEPVENMAHTASRPQQPVVQAQTGSGGGLPFQIFEESSQPASQSSRKDMALKPLQCGNNQALETHEPQQFPASQPMETNSLKPVQYSSSSDQPMQTNSIKPLQCSGQAMDTNSGNRFSDNPFPIFCDEQNTQVHPLFDDNDAIQSHIRDDITMAPVGSHLSFAASAKFASTPFSGDPAGSGRKKPPCLDVSDIEMAAAEEAANMSGVEFESAGPVVDLDVPEQPPAVPAPSPPSVEVTQTDSNVINDQTANNLSGNSFRNKNLSPIMEGSTEDSGASSKYDTLHDTLFHSRNATANKKQLTPVLDQSERSLHSLLIDGNRSNSISPGLVLDGSTSKCVNSLLSGNGRTPSPGVGWNGSPLAVNGLQEGYDGNQSTHVIDMSAYVAEEVDERTEALMSTSICVAPHDDPFDIDHRNAILNSLTVPLHQFDNYNTMYDYLPDIMVGCLLPLGIDAFEVIAKIGEGGFAKIYLVEPPIGDFTSSNFLSPDSNGKYVIKVEEPAQKWEFYICAVLHQRLAMLKDTVDMRPAVMQINNGFFFENGSLLCSDYQPNGTLLDFVNKAWKSVDLQPHMETMVLYMTIELLRLIDNIHRCCIIHGDIKPDNFLMMQFPKVPVSTDPQVVFGGHGHSIQLIDFGQSIDMSKYAPGTTFLTKVATQCFQCIEMKTDRPWTYQTDLFGLIGTINVLVQGQYMKVYQEAGIWKTSANLNRRWNTNLWKKLFHSLLNVRSCFELPDLTALRKEFELYFIQSHVTKYNSLREQFNKLIQTNK